MGLMKVVYLGVHYKKNWPVIKTSGTVGALVR